MADVSVRPARPQDAELVAHLQLSTWRTAYADLLPAEVLDAPLKQVAAVWLNAIEAPPSDRHLLLVAQERDQVVGFAASQPVPDDEGLEPAVTSELATLLVEPRWGRRGHGSRLLAASVEHWRHAGTTLATTWVFERDQVTRGFLIAAGWEADGLVRGLDVGPRVQRQSRFHVDVSAEP